MPALLQNNECDFNQVKNWEICKSARIFIAEKAFVPVHIPSREHWCLMVAHVQQKQIIFFDPLYSEKFTVSLGNSYMNHFLQVLKNVAESFEVTAFDISTWKCTIASKENVPQQLNGYDCGVFVLLTTIFLMDDLPLVFNQSEIPFFRKKLCGWIITGEIDF